MNPEPHPHRVFAHLLPKCHRNEDLLLEKSIRRFGILFPIVILPDGSIIDGYRRWRIAKSLKIHIPTKVVHFESQDAAIRWVIELHQSVRQFSNRNVRYYRAFVYELAENENGRSSLKKYPHKNPGMKKTRRQVWRQLVAEHGCCWKTLIMDAYFKYAIDNLDKSIVHNLMTSTAQIPILTIYELSKMPRTEQLAMWSEANQVAENLTRAFIERKILTDKTKDARTSKKRMIKSLRLLSKIRDSLPKAIAKDVDSYLKILGLHIHRHSRPRFDDFTKKK